MTEDEYLTECDAFGRVPDHMVKKVLMRKLKLYVWRDFEPDYTGGLAFAIAYTKREAQKLVTESCGYHVHRWGQLEVHDLTNPISFAISGGS